MKRERAKEILSAHRPGVDPGSDPEVREACRLAESDVELAAWLDRDRAFDARFREALAEVPVPDLPIPAATRRGVSRRGWLLAAAAAVAILAGGLGPAAWRAWLGNDRGMEALANFRDAMAYFIAEGAVSLDRTGAPLPELEAFMASRDALAGDALHRVFADAQPVGCKVIGWRERTVSLYCFVNRNGDLVHAFLIAAGDLGDPGAAVAGVLRLRGLQTGGWVDGGTAYLLVGSKPYVSIETYLDRGREPRLASLAPPPRG